jgi:VanZ family protein
MSNRSIARVGGVAILVALLLFAALGPAKWQVRTGLGWQFDHVVGYFAFTLMFSLAWPRPLLVGGALMATAMLLEALQTFTPDRHCDLRAALLGAGGALAGALVLDLFSRARIRMNGLAVLMPQRPSLWGWNNVRMAWVTARVHGVPRSSAARRLALRFPVL